MDIKEVLKFADDLVLAKTGKHLDNLQQAILLASWQGKRYSQVAKDFHCTERHVGNIASKLWKIMSEILEENISKSTFQSAIERYQVSNVSNFGQLNLVQKGNIRVCTETSHPPKTPQNSPPAQTSNKANTEQKPRLDLRDAPDDLKTFYHHPSLTTIESAIAQNSRLITITGMSGTGKSAIARHLIPQIQTQFDCIIWRSLRTSPPLETTLKNLIQFLSNQPEINIPTNTDSQLAILIEYLRDRTSLIILDDVQQILNSEQLAGNYKPGYENYGTLFKLIGEIPHHSCFILNSWEPPSDILTFTEDHSAVRLLPLIGLGEAATELLQEKGLLDQEYFPELINLYQGNPLWLKLVAQTINNLFSGRVSQYLNYESVLLSDELKPILHQHYQRLSEGEKQAITQLSQENETISLTQFLAKYQGESNLLTAIQSLARRGMIAKFSNETETVFTIQYILKKYVKIVGEIIMS